MKQTTRKVLIVVFMLSFAYGCGPGLKATKRMIDLADKNYAAAKNVAELDKESFSEDLEKAEKELKKAHKSIKFGLAKSAYDSSAASFSYSQRIIKDAYQNNIAPMATRLKNEINQIDDDAHPLKDKTILAKLDKIVNFTDQISTIDYDFKHEDLTDPNADQIVFALADAVVEDFKSVADIQQMVDTSLDAKLETDYSFDAGQYKLTQEGMRFLNQFADKIIKAIPEGKNVKIKIKIVGYTDALAFRYSTAKFLKKFEKNLPRNLKQKRKILNKRLATLRAEAISTYLRAYFSKDKTHGISNINFDIEGLGEKIPYDVEPPYPQNDQRRRICKIYVYMLELSKQS